MKRISQQKGFDYILILRRVVESPIFTTLAFAAIFLFLYADTIVSKLHLPPAFLSSSHEHHLDDHQTTETENIRKLAFQEKIDEFANDEVLDPLIPPDNVTKEKRLVWFRKKLPQLEILKSNNFTQKFHGRVIEFLNNGCSTQFHMIWLSPAKSFGKREFLTMDTLFKSHPKGCLMIISNSLDSELGYIILKPLLDRGFKILAITPDLPFLVKSTPAESWLDDMKSGRRDPGSIPLPQNLSNLIRLAMLYKYGGIYLDIDFVILKDVSSLRNAVGAQSIDPESKNWTRLNGAVMIFGIHHPILRDFMDEFTSTFNGNRWGYNGPYLVSRVVKKVGSTPGYNLTVVPPKAFYPVDWNRIWRLYRKPQKDSESKWVERRLKELNEGETYAVHLWNKRSRALAIEEGSVMARLISENCVICQDIYSS